MTLLKWGIIGGIGVVALFFLWPWVSKLGQPAEGGTISGGIPLGGTYTEKGAVPIEISIQVPETAPTISKDSFTLEQQAFKTTAVKDPHQAYREAVLAFAPKQTTAQATREKEIFGKIERGISPAGMLERGRKTEPATERYIETRGLKIPLQPTGKEKYPEVTDVRMGTSSGNGKRTGEAYVSRGTIEVPAWTSPTIRQAMTKAGYTPVTTGAK